MNTTVSLTEQELAHVLVGLRMMQDQMRVFGRTGIENAYEQLEGIETLTDETIDELCERINCADDKPRISINVQGGVVVGARANVDIVVEVFDEDSDFEDADDFDTAQSEHNSLPVEVY